MIALALIVIVVLLTIALFYLKCDVLTSATTVIAALFGIIAAMGFHETLGNFILAKGYGGSAAYWGTAIVLFIIVFGITRAGAWYILNPSIHFSDMARQISAVVCGGLCGLLIAGMLLIVLAMSPLGNSLTYDRYEMAGAVIPDKPNRLLINADGLVSSLFSWISRGSLAGGKSFAFYHPDFLNQIHLNRASGVYPVAGKRPIILPGKNFIRQQDIDDKSLVVIRIGLPQMAVNSGGAVDPKGVLSLIPAQLRMICKPKGLPNDGSGTGSVLYPVGFVKDRKLEPLKANEILTIDQKEATGLRFGQAVWKDVAYQVPSNLNPLMLNFKYNSFSTLPAVVVSTVEIEQELNARRQDENENPSSADQGN
jgi:hypothetical protein